MVHRSFKTVFDSEICSPASTSSWRLPLRFWLIRTSGIRQDPRGSFKSGKYCNTVFYKKRWERQGIQNNKQMFQRPTGSNLYNKLSQLLSLSHGFSGKTATGTPWEGLANAFVCLCEVLRPSQQLWSCRAGQLPVNSVPGQASLMRSACAQQTIIAIV